MRIKDLPTESRPRERLLAEGPSSLSNIDLVAILLRTGTKGSSAIHIAEALLAQFGSLSALAHADLSELRSARGIGQDKAVTLKSAFTLAQRMARELRTNHPLLDTPSRIAALLREELHHSRVESCIVVLLNSRHRLIRTEHITTGTVDSLLIHPREVFRPAILHQAASIVLVHNHPSGDPKPSESDIRVTQDLARAGRLLRIDFVDHVILGRCTQENPIDYTSLRELGFISG